MRACSIRLCAVLLIPAALWSGGCGTIYMVFGDGGLWPKGGTGSNANSTSTTQPATIHGASYSARQLDPLLESTAGARVVVAADMNRDGAIDFVSGSAESQPIQLHLRNGAAPDYMTITIAGGAPISTMYDLQVADFDSDGFLDIAVLVNDTGFIPVTGADKRGTVVLLFAPADTSNALAWQSVTINATFVLPGDNDGLTDFAVADMDGVNGPDIVLASNEIISGTNSATKHIFLFRNSGGAAARNGSSWLGTTTPIATDAPPVKAVEVADMDGDGDLDVIATFPIAKSSNVRWIINPLNEAGVAALAAGDWTDRIIGEQRQLNQPGDEQVPGGDFLAVGDIDGDGAIDAVVAHQSLGVIQWFANPGTAIVQVQTFPWQVFNIGKTANAAQINQLQLVDLDLNGALDVFISGSGNMAGFQRQADVFNYWQPFTITGTNPVAAIGRCAFSDVNGDGRLDIIAPMDREGITNDQFLILTRLTP